MALCGARKAETDRRRARVAELRLEGLSHRAIADRLAEENVRPSTHTEDHPVRWSYVTVGNDCALLTQQWRMRADSSMEELLDAQADTLNELMLASLKAVRQGTKRVIGYREIKGEEGTIKEPIFEACQDLPAIQTAVKVRESLGSLLGIDKRFKLSEVDKRDIADKLREEIAAVFNSGPDEVK